MADLNDPDYGESSSLQSSSNTNSTKLNEVRDSMYYTSSE